MSVNGDLVELVEQVELEQRSYIGIPVTASFDETRNVGDTASLFMRRWSEIPFRVQEKGYCCLHYANQVLFTYIYAMEVSTIASVPDGMIGFTVPAGRYAKVRSVKQEPYAVIQSYLNQNGLEVNASLLSIESFRFGEVESKYNADIWVPIKKVRI